MKLLFKYGKLGIGLTLLVFFLIGILAYRHDKKFVRENFALYTGAKEIIVRTEYHDSHQSYIEAIISYNDKASLLTKYKFEDGLDKLEGRTPCPFIVIANPEYQYVILDGYGQYGYILMAMEKNGNNVIVYEEYSE